MADDKLTAELAPIRERTRKASPGPWKVEREHLYDMDDAPFSLPSVTGPDGREIFSGSVDQPGEDLRFAAHAREDVPRLLKAVDAVLKLAEELTGDAAPCSALEEDRAWVRAACAGRFREAVARELAGKRGDRG